MYFLREGKSFPLFRGQSSHPARRRPVRPSARFPTFFNKNTRFLQRAAESARRGRMLETRNCHNRPARHHTPGAENAPLGRFSPCRSPLHRQRNVRVLRRNQIGASGAHVWRRHRGLLPRGRQRVAAHPLGARPIAWLVLVFSAAVLHHAHRFRELRVPGAEAGGGVPPQGEAQHALAHTCE